MKMHFTNEYNFEDFKQDLRQRLEEWAPRSLEEENLRPSAVKMLLMSKDDEVHVLLTNRSDKVSTHKGQISFPGGAYDEGDEDIRFTAYRETFEEVGIPENDIEYIGQFDDYVSVFGHHVSCFVGALEYPYDYSFNRDEIDDFVEAPLSMFVDMAYERTECYNHQGRDVTVYYYYYGGQEIWGLTARILTDFGQKIIRGTKK